MDDKIAIRRRVVMSVGVIALVLVIDQIIKIAVKTHMWVGERISVTDWFQIFFTENKGMAFGLDFFGTFLLGAVSFGGSGWIQLSACKTHQEKSTVWLGGLLGLLDSRCCRQHHRQLLLWPDIF